MLPALSDGLRTLRDTPRLASEWWTLRQERAPGSLRVIDAIEARMSDPTVAAQIRAKAERLRALGSIVGGPHAPYGLQLAAYAPGAMVPVFHRARHRLHPRWRDLSLKEYAELEFWKGMHADFPLDRQAFLASKRVKYLSGLNLGSAASDRGPLVSEAHLRTCRFVLDVGGGPWGAIDAVGAPQALCIDTLADYYQLYPLESYDAHYLAAPAERLPLLDDSVDFVFCVNALDHCSLPPRVVREIHRVLRPGGQALLSFYVFSGWGDPTEPFRLTPNWAWRHLDRSFVLHRFEVVPARAYTGLEHDVCRARVEKPA
jgi:SAM-dependent methyltransferase